MYLPLSKNVPSFDSVTFLFPFAWHFGPTSHLRQLISSRQYFWRNFTLQSSLDAGDVNVLGYTYLPKVGCNQRTVRHKNGIVKFFISRRTVFGTKLDMKNAFRNHFHKLERKSFLAADNRNLSVFLCIVCVCVCVCVCACVWEIEREREFVF